MAYEGKPQLSGLFQNGHDRSKVCQSGWDKLMRGGFHSCRDYSNNFNYPLYLIEHKNKHFNMSKSRIPH